jgi:transcriptional regulator with XRE-family HTH domain
MEGNLEAGRPLQARIRARRTAAGLTQEQLAAKIGTGRNTVMRWESGSSAPGPINQARLAQVLGGSPADYERGESELSDYERAEWSLVSKGFRQDQLTSGLEARIRGLEARVADLERDRQLEQAIILDSLADDLREKVLEYLRERLAPSESSVEILQKEPDASLESARHRRRRTDAE